MPRPETSSFVSDVELRPNGKQAIISPHRRKRVLAIVMIVLAIVVLMVAFDIGVLWLATYIVRAVWAWMVWVAESIYWFVSSLFEVHS